MEAVAISSRGTSSAIVYVSFDRCKPKTLVRFFNDRANLTDLGAFGLAIRFKTTFLATLHVLMQRTEWARAAIAG
jgi:hypothetical protein